MAVHDTAAFLAQAVDSIRTQTFRDWEFIIIDDASTDGTAKLLSGICDERIICRRNSTRQQLARSLNSALSVARGELVARMDGDDVSNPLRFEQQWGYLRAHPKIGLLGTNYSLIDDQGETFCPRVLPRGLSPAETEWSLYWGNPIAHPSVMVRADLLRRAGGYSEGYRHYAEDLDLWFTLSKHSQLAVMDEVLFKHRRHGHNVTHVDRDAHLAEVVTVAGRALAAQAGTAVSPAAVRLLRRLPPPPRWTGDDLQAAQELVYKVWRNLAARHTPLDQNWPTASRDLAEQLLRLTRAAVGLSRSTAAASLLSTIRSDPKLLLTAKAFRVLARIVVGNTSHIA